MLATDRPPCPPTHSSVLHQALIQDFIGAQRIHGRRLLHCLRAKGNRDSLLVKAPDSSSIGRIPAEAAGDFSSPESTLCADSYSVSVPPPPVLPQWHVKDPCHSAKSAGGRLHLNTHIKIGISLRELISTLKRKRKKDKSAGGE